MQETGNNIVQPNKVLSIRLSSNGQYFSVVDDNSPIVRISLDTEKVVLVPESAFRPELAKSYLDINSITLQEDECAVVSTTVDGVIAVMVWNSAEIEGMRSQFGVRLQLYSPIQENIAHKISNSIEINRCAERLYITLFNDKLEFAECLPYRSLADILYYTENLESQFGMNKRTIYICGDERKLLTAQLKRYYRKVTLRD